MWRRLDELIDRALAGYCEAPRAGLERRVLRRMRARRSRWTWPLVAGLAAAVGGCLVVGHWPERGVIEPHGSMRAGEIAHSTMQKQEPKLAPRVPVGRRTVRSVALPRLAVFPTPAPLTDGERALLALMQQHPNAAREVAARLNANLEPIEIAPLEIVPLDQGEKQ